MITIGGKAGQGVLSSGTFVKQIMSTLGFYTFNWTEYPSLIKGGHNSVMIRVSTRSIMSPVKRTHVVVALDKVSIEMHWDEIESGGVLIYDSSNIKDNLSATPTKTQLFYAIGVPLGEISRSIDKSSMYINTAALGALHSVLDIPTTVFENILESKYKKKSVKIVDNNQYAVQ